jgi:WD40 repeat protein
MITSTLIIYPEDDLNPEQFKRKMRFVTSSRDGTVKIWNAFNLNLEKTIEVTDGVWVTCTQYMTLSKRLIAASANRMISFYDLETTNYNVPVSRIEGLVGIPLCMEYYRWPKNNEQKFETLLVGDDLGICNMYTFTSQNWHICQYKLGSRDPNRCHAKEIEEDFTDKVSKEFES